MEISSNSQQNIDAEIAPQEIAIEDSKMHLEPGIRAPEIKSLEPILKRLAIKKENSDSMKIQRLTELLKYTLRRKIATGDSIEELVEIMRNSAVFEYLHDLNNERFFNMENAALDLGEKPKLIHGRGIFKNCTNAATPHSTKSRFIVEYSECTPAFYLHDIYKNSGFDDHSITEDEFTNSIKGAENVLLKFRGSVINSDMCFLIWFLISFVFILGGGMAMGALISYIITIIISSVYAVILIIVYFCLKRRNLKLLIYGHLALAIYCRCENNRLYLRKKILMRPGYMAKWIEFNMIPNSSIHSTMEAS